MTHAHGNDLRLGPMAGTSQELILPRDVRDKHLYVCGGTGAGKSRFLEYLIRQDIAAWRTSGCGLLLLDYHGAVYDGLTRWMAYHGIKRPIIPIDLRRDDWIVAYNVLRKRKNASADVVVSTFVQAMAYVWGESGTENTPRFARWAGNTLRALYDKGYTLAEARFLMDRLAVGMRKAMTTGLDEITVARDWAHANELSPKDFESQVESTINRMNCFVKSEFLKPVFGQNDVSLDLGEVLEKGAIVLVSLARERGKATSEDAHLFATLLLNDLWTAAQERGKRQHVKPFYLYLDEFQHFVSPTISENLDEARGFGLHVTMANQFPAQLSGKGQHGEQLLRSVMENATTKVVFRLTDSVNLKPMAEWLFRHAMDPDMVKHMMYSTKVVDYREEMRESTSQSTTRGSSRGTQTSHTTTDLTGGANTASFSYVPTDDPLAPEPEPYSASVSGSESWNVSDGTTSAESESESESESVGVTRTPMLIPVLGRELSHVQFRSLEEQLFTAMAAISGQEKRYCVARCAEGMRAPVSLYVPTVADPPIRQERVEQYIQKQFAQQPCFLPKAEALRRLAERQERLERHLRELPSVSEPTTTRRKLTRP